MRLVGFAMLVALAAGSASAQIVFKPTKPKQDVTEDSVKTAVSPVGKDFNREIRELPAEITSEAEKEVRADRGADGKVKEPAVKPCKDCVAPTKPHQEG